LRHLPQYGYQFTNCHHTRLSKASSTAGLRRRQARIFEAFGWRLAEGINPPPDSCEPYTPMTIQETTGTRRQVLHKQFRCRSARTKMEQ
jgi:hypothetical protein